MARDFIANIKTVYLYKIAGVNDLKLSIIVSNQT